MGRDKKNEIKRQSVICASLIIYTKACKRHLPKFFLDHPVLGSDMCFTET